MKILYAICGIGCATSSPCKTMALLLCLGCYHAPEAAGGNPCTADCLDDGAGIDARSSPSDSRALPCDTCVVDAASGSGTPDAPPPGPDSAPLGPATLAISPTSQTFFQGASHTFMVTNSGAASTGPMSTSIGGANPGVFFISQDTCATTSLAGGGTCWIIAWYGCEEMEVAATLAVSASPGGTASAALSGTASACL